MTNRTRAAVVSVLLALVAAAPQAASAKGSPVRSVSSATHVTPGEPLPLEVQVKGPATIAFYLSADAARDKNDVKLGGGAKLRARRKRLVSAEPTIPASLPPGTYH